MGSSARISALMESDGTGHREDEEASHAQGRPRDSGAAEGCAQDNGRKRYRQRYGAKIVDRPLLLRRSRAQDGTNEEQGDGSRRQGVIEDPPP